MAFALPLLWFAVRRQIPAGYGWRLGALLALGGFQGAIGWWMVASGLSVRTDVSHIRLAVHLLTALTILAGIVWTALDLMALHRDPSAPPARLTRTAVLALAALVVQLVYGAFTAGLDAGYAFASWPLMGDALFPRACRWSTRRGAMRSTIPSSSSSSTAGGPSPPPPPCLAGDPRDAQRIEGGLWVVLLVTLQIVLGIATLMSGVQIDIAVAHQGNAALLLIATVFAAHAIGGRDRRFA